MSSKSKPIDKDALGGMLGIIGLITIIPGTIAVDYFYIAAEETGGLWIFIRSGFIGFIIFSLFFCAIQGLIDDTRTPEDLARVKRERDKQNAIQEEFSNKRKYGEINPVLFCQNCQTKGKVRSKQIDHKKGVSGGKAAAGLMTGGVSLLATGLSRKEKAFQMHCDNCNTDWIV